MTKAFIAVCNICGSCVHEPMWPVHMKWHSQNDAARRLFTGVKVRTAKKAVKPPKGGYRTITPLM